GWQCRCLRVQDTFLIKLDRCVSRHQRLKVEESTTKQEPPKPARVADKLAYTFIQYPLEISGISDHRRPSQVTRMVAEKQMYWGKLGNVSRLAKKMTGSQEARTPR